MNAQEALKICREALKDISNNAGFGYSKDIAQVALAATATATASIEQPTASTEDVIDRFINKLPLPQYPARSRNECGCWRCINERGGMTFGAQWMVLCPICGNKRCPYANDHVNACTGSNDPGQPGSAHPKTDLSIPEPKIDVIEECVEPINVTDWAAS